MTKRVVDYDPLTGITTYFDYDHASDISIVSREGDVEAVLDANKRMANDAEYTKDGMRKEFWHYARLPPIVVEKFITEYGINPFNRHHAKEFFKKLNSPEWRYLKTTTKNHMPR